MKYTIILSSDEYPSEFFNYDSLEDALAGLGRLAISGAGHFEEDGISRRLELVMEKGQEKDSEQEQEQEQTNPPEITVVVFDGIVVDIYVKGFPNPMNIATKVVDWDVQDEGALETVKRRIAELDKEDSGYAPIF